MLTSDIIISGEQALNMSHTSIPDGNYYYTHGRKKGLAGSDFRKALEFVASKVSEKDQNYSLLEIGCGMAETRNYLPLSVGYYGIDPNEFVINRLKESGVKNIHLGHAEKLPFDNSYFDFVFSTNVLEHVYNPTKALSEMVRVIKLGGHIIILAPNHESPRSRLEAIRHYSALQKLTFLIKRWGDLFLRLFGVIKFRIIPKNYTEHTGIFERSDDDLKYVTSGYEVAKFLEKENCQEIYSKEFSKNSLFKKLLIKIPALKYQGRGIFFIFRKI